MGNTGLWQPITDIENTVLISKVFKCYLGGLAMNIIRIIYKQDIERLRERQRERGGGEREFGVSLFLTS